MGVEWGVSCQVSHEGGEGMDPCRIQGFISPGKGWEEKFVAAPKLQRTNLGRAVLGRSLHKASYSLWKDWGEIPLATGVPGNLLGICSSPQVPKLHLEECRDYPVTAMSLHAERWCCCSLFTHFPPRIQLLLRFSLPCVPGGDFCGWGGQGLQAVPSGLFSPVIRECGALLMSSFRCLKLIFYFYLDLTRVLWQCECLLKVLWSHPCVPVFHSNFNAQHILPILSKFLLEKCIKFQPRSILSFEIHRFIPHYVSWKSSSAALGMKISWIYTEIILLLLHMLDFSWL